MNRMHLWNMDLNLLVVLDALLREQSVTNAAAELHRTQSAISHALSRLRDLFDDELLVRDGRRMRPTARGQALAESLPRVLDLLARTLDEPETFDPSAANRTFRLAAPDFVGAILPSLLRVICDQAPRAVVELVSVDRSAPRDVAEGRYDGLVAPLGLDHEGLRVTPIGQSLWRVFGRTGHPAFEAWSLDAWQAWPHLKIRTSPTGEGPVDGAAAARGVSRTVGAVLSTFAIATEVLASTDLLLTVPDMAIPHEEPRLARQDSPLDLAPMALGVYRSAVAGAEPGVRWFLEQVTHVLAARLEPLESSS